MMDMETERCLVGTIDLACTIGQDITTRMLTIRNDLYKKEDVVRLLPEDMIQSLGVSRALHVAVGAALADLCERWEQELAPQIIQKNVDITEETQCLRLYNLYCFMPGEQLA